MKNTTIFLFLLIAFIIPSTNQAVAAGSNNPANANPKRPHRVLRHGSTSKSSIATKPQTAPARGAAIGAADQAAAGGDSNPLLQKKKHN